MFHNLKKEVFKIYQSKNSSLVKISSVEPILNSQTSEICCGIQRLSNADFKR